MTGVQIGVDVGGTFTDVAYFVEPGDNASILKIQSTPDDLGRAVGNDVIAASAGRSIDAPIHGTTVAANVHLQRETPALALLVTNTRNASIEQRERD